MLKSNALYVQYFKQKVYSHQHNMMEILCIKIYNLCRVYVTEQNGNPMCDSQ